ncbi:MAG TPA: J domain-containing protein [Polyangiaceae bacterium]|nr:J domain-containing protein [Polyangiaceae bacterium]
MRLGKDVVSTDLYGILGVPRSATPDQIRRAYRLQAMTSHPDLHGRSAEQRMVELNVAACVLLDGARRAAYDRARHPEDASPAADARPEPFYPWSATADRSVPDWAPAPSHARRHAVDREVRRAVELWRDTPGRAFAALSDYSASWPPGMHLLVCFSAICVAMLLIASARPRSLPGFERERPLACAADPALEG